MNFYNNSTLKSNIIWMLIIFIFLSTFSVDLEAKKNNKKIRKKILPPSHVFLQDTMLDNGVYYQRAIINIYGDNHDASILKADLSKCDCSAKVIKAAKRINQLDKLQNIIQFYDSLENVQIFGAVNANFWRAYSNYPIGPVIIDGEIVQMNSYKEWSSILFNNQGLPFIDNFKISGKLILKNKITLEIKEVNKRTDSSNIVIYNKYSGVEIPAIDLKKVEENLFSLRENNDNDIIYNDSTEAEFNIEQMRQELIKSQLMSSLEYNTLKIKLRYLSEPAINSDIKCIVLSIDSSIVQIPEDGCIVSLGRNIFFNSLPNIGDTIILKFTTNSFTKEIFTDGVCGTPRLVRHGVAKHEAEKEGSRSKRFINKNLPRTAIGFNKNKNIIYFVAIKPNGNETKTVGANLKSLAGIMKYIGCYEAMNLDGGGSTIMVVNGKNVLSKENPNSSRSISVGIGISKTKLN